MNVPSYSKIHNYLDITDGRGYSKAYNYLDIVRRGYKPRQRGWVGLPPSEMFTYFRALL